MDKGDWLLLEDDLLYAAKRYTEGDHVTCRDKREARRCLRKLLRHGSYQARFEAWKIVDSGVVGNRPSFLFLRVKEMADGASEGIGIFPFGKSLVENYAGVLIKWRIVLYIVEILALLIVLIKLIF